MMERDSNAASILDRPSRRRVLGTGAAALLLMGRAVVAAEPVAAGVSAAAIQAWLKITPDDTVTILLAQSEMGQGIATTLPLALADELGADWPRVKCEWSDFDPV